MLHLYFICSLYITPEYIYAIFFNDCSGSAGRPGGLAITLEYYY